MQRNDPMSMPVEAKTGGGFSWQRLIPAAVLVAGIVGFFAAGLDRYVSFDTLRDNRAALTAFVAAMPFAAVAVFATLYALSTAFSLPGGALLTVASGFLFGIWAGTAIVVVAATVGAVAVFLAAKTALGDSLRRRAGPTIQKMQDGFREDALSYLLVLRLVPLFPFFLVNLVPAFLGVPLRTYVLGTAIGIIPGTFVFTSVGAGLGSIFDSMEEFSLAGALTPEVIAALVGLSLLSLLPVVYKRRKARAAVRR